MLGSISCKEIGKPAAGSIVQVTAMRYKEPRSRLSMETNQRSYLSSHVSVLALGPTRLADATRGHQDLLGDLESRASPIAGCE
jgi:hypothetical protein